MHSHFDQYAQEGHEFLHRLAVRLGDEDDMEKAMRILCSVFQILRERLTIEESMQLIAQLPMSLKGLYVDGWSIHSKRRRLKTIEQFASEFVIAGRQSLLGDFYGEEEVLVAIRTVMETLADYVSSEEIEDMIGTMPEDLKQLLESWIMRYK
jgi:uncharacterized protein (DUF2267 family)